MSSEKNVVSILLRYADWNTVLPEHIFILRRLREHDKIHYMIDENFIVKVKLKNEFLVKLEKKHQKVVSIVKDRIQLLIGPNAEILIVEI